MPQSIDLKELEKKAYASYRKDGLLDILLGSFVSLFAVAPLLSSRFGDFWSSAAFLPIWGLIFLAIRHVRKHITMPRIGTVKFSSARKKKLRIFTIVMLTVNALTLVLGVFVSYYGGTRGSTPVIWLGIIMLAGFSIGAYFLDFPRLYLYGVLAGLSPIAGEWLSRTLGASHHGFPVTFGIMSSAMILYGIFLFVRFLHTTPLPEGPMSEVVQ